MARRRSGPHRQTRKTILVLSAVVTVIIVAILLVNIVTFEGPPLMPPEDPETIAKRNAPENQFDTILAIGERAPQVPEPFHTRDDETYGFAGTFQAPCGSVAHMLGVNRLDDDPVLDQYMDQRLTLAPEIEAALSEGYVLNPTPDAFAEQHNQLPGYHAVFNLASGIAAASQVRAISSGDWKSAHEGTLLGIRLATAWGADGTTSASARSAHAQQRALRYYYESVIAQAPADGIQSLIDALEEASLADHDLTPNLEYGWRCIDSPHVGQYLWGRSNEQLQDEGFDSRIFVMQYISKTKADIENNREGLLRSAKGTNAEHRTWLQTVDGEFDRFGYSIKSLTSAIEERANLRAMIAGLRVAAGIEAYKREHGALPEALGELDIETTDPLHPNGASFRYRLKEDDFTLYSVGADGHNHKAYTGGRRARDVIIHRAAAECAEEHQEFLDRF